MAYTLPAAIIPSSSLVAINILIILRFPTLALFSRVGFSLLIPKFSPEAVAVSYMLCSIIVL